MRDHADEKLLESLEFIPELIEHNGPHFMAPNDINFHKFMGIIVANFFDEEDNCGDILRSLGLGYEHK